MRAACVLLCLALPAFGVPVFPQTQPAATPMTTACGPDNIKFDVRHDGNQHMLAQPEPGKALVYVIEVYQHPPGLGISPTVRVGLNGAWVGANQGTSYFSFSVDPGEEHLCANWQSIMKQFSNQHSFVNFTAEAGKVYFFRVLLQATLIDYGPHAPPPLDNVAWSMDFAHVNAEEGKDLVSSSSLSISKAKK